jgi:hypothetical protein
LPAIPNSVEQLAEEVRNGVGERGYMKVPSLSLSDFDELAARLGPLVGRTTVTAKEASKSVLNSAAAMPFHTDAPEAAMVGWWCGRSAYPNGASLLIDTSGLPTALDREHLDELTRTPIRRWVAPGQFELIPCLTMAEGHYRVFYTPWFLLDSYPVAQLVALEAFQTFLRSRRPIVVRLQEQACLFIDNGRMMHGRNEYSASSGRRLERVWIGMEITR